MFYIYVWCRRGKWERVEGERGRGESEMGEGREREKTLTFATCDTGGKPSEGSQEPIERHRARGPIGSWVWGREPMRERLCLKRGSPCSLYIVIVMVLTKHDPACSTILSCQSISSEEELSTSLGLISSRASNSPNEKPPILTWLGGPTFMLGGGSFPIPAWVPDAFCKKWRFFCCSLCQYQVALLHAFLPHFWHSHQ